MKFRNKTNDARELSLDGISLTTVAAKGAVDDHDAPLDELEVPADKAAGFVLQCGDDGAWEPADDEAAAAVETAYLALEKEHPGFGEPLEGVEHPADGTLSPTVSNPPKTKAPRSAAKKENV